MGRLKTLKPRLQTLGNRVQSAPSTSTPRPSGRNWQETRLRIQTRDKSRCTDCGTLWQAHCDHVDHDIPRHLGGSDEDSNLRLRCIECHKAKSQREAAGRARGG